MHGQDDIDTLLRQRHAPQTPEGLNARIIAAAARTPQRKRDGLLSVIREIILSAGALWTGPQPAFALAGFLVIGLYLGMAAYQTTPSPDEPFDFIMMDEEWL